MATYDTVLGIFTAYGPERDLHFFRMLKLSLKEAK